MSAVKQILRPIKAGVIKDPRYWQGSAGYEYQANFGNIDLVTAMGISNDGLNGHGWEVSVSTVTDGASGDFLSSADIDPTRIVPNASTGIGSPRVFGSYSHILAASYFLKYMPTTLCMEAYASFSNMGSNLSTFIGFNTPASIGAQNAGSVAGIYSNGTNFALKSFTNTHVGSAIDAGWHRFRIEVTATDTYWYIDDVYQGSFATEADAFPTAFRMYASVLVLLSYVRVYYK